ncbi:hypothetical protein LJC10_05830 [Selenomonadales bacterium OttesenSCG-928-I06]|nr:hypothetical protein [Selenomonadales bacterium OttesenSCG-928-I06]
MAESSVNSEDEEESGWASKDGIKAARNLRGESSVDEMLGSKGNANVPKSLGDARVGVVGDERKVLDGVAGAVDVAESLGGTSNVAQDQADKAYKKHVESQNSGKLKTFPFDDEEKEIAELLFDIPDDIGTSGSYSEKYWGFQQAQYLGAQNKMAVLASKNPNFKDTEEYEFLKGRMDIVQKRAEEAGYNLLGGFSDEIIMSISKTATVVTLGGGTSLGSLFAGGLIEGVDSSGNRDRDVGMLIISYSSYKNNKGEYAPHSLAKHAAEEAYGRGKTESNFSNIATFKWKPTYLIWFDVANDQFVGYFKNQVGDEAMAKEGFFPSR